VNAVRIRRAGADDVPFLVALATHEDVEPFLGSVAARDAEAVAAEVDRSAANPREFGRFVVEIDGHGEWTRAGAMGFEAASVRHRIAHLERIAIHPDFRGRRLADEAARLLQRHLLFELGYHRLQLEVYGFNERAIRHAERAGFVREGVKRKAYWRHERWNDGVMFGLLREDLEDAYS
jgi:RimJ/RimL family protein N-acetyltransferase